MKDKGKIILLVVLLLAVAAVIAWNLGVFSGGGSKPAPAPNSPPPQPTSRGVAPGAQK
jgi:hypothetical protein